MRSRRVPRTLPDPEKHFSNVSERRVPQLEFGPPLPTFRARQELLFTSNVGAATSELLWDVWENGDARIFEEEMDIVSTNLLRIVRFKKPGWYGINLDIGWDPDFAGTVGGDFSDGWDLPTAFWYPRLTGISNVDNAFTTLISYPLFRPQLATPTGFPTYMANTLYSVSQNSGLNRNTDTGTSLEIVYFGRMPVEEWRDVI